MVCAACAAVMWHVVWLEWRVAFCGSLVLVIGFLVMLFSPCFGFSWRASNWQLTQETSVYPDRWLARQAVAVLQPWNLFIKHRLKLAPSHFSLAQLACMYESACSPGNVSTQTFAFDDTWMLELRVVCFSLKWPTYCTYLYKNLACLKFVVS